ncbi:uncharacterized protein TrAFT101_001097 [Trichoderma asperellum]|uniref:uncharacterized protein n=1 Tax=Trichoderma asperellum TaxID=101201 RepID=UPI00332EF3C0|nr:hypothetical protein TrAFT101_001097 [Trichoderma asperellum]
MDITTWVAKGRRAFRSKKDKRIDTGSVGDEQTSSTPEDINNLTPPKPTAADQPPDEIFVPNESDVLPESSVVAPESETPTDLPTKDSKKPEEAISQSNEINKVSSSITSASNRLDSAESYHQAPRDLWEVAYDNLRLQHADLLEEYERILTLWLRAYSLQQNRKFDCIEEPGNLFQCSNHQERRQYAQNIIAFCLDAQQERDAGADSGDEGSQNSNSETISLRFSKETRDVLKSSIDNVEDAALAWAGTCLALQGLLDSTDRPEKLLGINYIASRMAWYTLLPKLLDDDESEQTSLRDRITELYQQIFLFQIRIVCSQTDTIQESDFFQIDQDLFSRDGDLNEADVVKAEQALMCFKGNHIEAQIRSLVTFPNDEKNDVIGDETPEPEESDMKITIKNLNAVDPRKNNLEANIPSLESLYEWVNSTPEFKDFTMGESRLLWVCGDPDAGRTMVFWSIIRGLSQTSLGLEPKFLSFSMCGTGENEVESTVSVLKTLIYLVLNHQPQLSKYLIEKCNSTDRKDFSDSNDKYALTLLLYEIIRDETFKPTIFLIGGIDEIIFEDEEPSSFASFIKTTMNLSQNVKWLISSSTESFESFSKSEDLHIAKDQCINIDGAYDAIQRTLNDHYIPSKVDQLAKHWSIEEEFRNEITELLKKISSGTFLRVDLACQAIQRENPWHAPSILQLWLSQPPAAYSDPLYNFYAPMRENIKNLPFNDSNICVDVLSTMATAARPLNLVELEVLLDFPAYFNVKVLVEKCFTFLELRDDTVHFPRKTARDFVLKESESKRAGLHSRMVERCLTSLSEYWSLPSTNSSQSRSKNSELPTGYLALYWARHLCNIDDANNVIHIVTEFFTQNLLKWLDLLVSSGLLSQARALVSALQSHVKKREIGARADDSRYRTFVSIINETNQLLRFHNMIQGAVGLTARVTLLFCPHNTTMQKIFLPKEWPQLEGPPMFKNYWDPATHILTGHSDYIRCCSYSHDGKFLASGSDDGSIRLWDTASGNVQHIFRAFDSDYVYNIALSSSGFIAAASQTTIGIWNLSTGQLPKLPVDEYVCNKFVSVGDITFSNDGNMLAAAVQRDIIFWHILDSKLIPQKVDASYKDDIRFIKFSEHDTLFGSVSNQTVTIWSLKDEVTDGVMDGAVQNVEFAIQNNRRLKKETDLTISTSHNDWACGIAFSPNLKYVATGTDEENKVYIWDWESGNPPMILTGHTGSINTVEFSSDGLFLASGSQDGTIRMWREPWTATQPPLILSGHSRSVYDLSFSPSETCLATCSSDETIRIWDYGSYKTQVQSEIDLRQSQNTPHARRISRIALSEDGKWVASASADGLICLWDGISGVLQRSLWEHRQDIESLVFSHDSRKLISGSDDRTVRIWNLEDDFQSRPLLGHRDWVRCAVLSRDGTFVASGSDDRTVRVWDLRYEFGHDLSNQEEEEEEEGERGESNGVQGLRILSGHRDYVMCVLFSQDGKYVVSGADDGEILLWSLHTDQANSSTQLTRIKNRGDGRINAMTFSADFKRLIASYAGSISIWDITGEDGNIRSEGMIKSETRSGIYSLSVNIKYPQYVISEGALYLSKT